MSPPTSPPPNLLSIDSPPPQCTSPVLPDFPLPKLSRREMMSIAAELAADSPSGAPSASSPALDAPQLHHRGCHFQIGTLSVAATPRKRLTDSFFDTPHLVPCPGFLVETGDADADGLLLQAYQRNSSALALIDRQRYTRYYSSAFKDKPHHGFVGVDARKKPIFLLVQELSAPEVAASKEIDGLVPYSRVLIITSRPWSPTSDAEFWVHCRLEGLSPKAQASKLHKVLEVQLPGLLACRKLRALRVPTAQLQREFLRLEGVLATRGYKFAVLSCAAHQSTESEILGNSAVSPDFAAFLEQLGQRIDVRAHDGFLGGLDAAGSTGSHAYYTMFQDFEILYHVGPLLSEADPSGHAQREAASEMDQQHWHRKRHVGNDIVIIIFCEPGHRTKAIDLLSFRSHMNHVFIVVSLTRTSSSPTSSSPSSSSSVISSSLSTSDGNVLYQIHVASKGGTHSYVPALPNPPAFPPGHLFTHFLLTKAINSERAAMYAPSFLELLGKARGTQLSDSMDALLPEADKARLLKSMIPATLSSKQLAREVSFRTEADYNPNAKPSPLFTSSPCPNRQLPQDSPVVSAKSSPSKIRMGAAHTAAIEAPPVTRSSTQPVDQVLDSKFALLLTPTKESRKKLRSSGGSSILSKPTPRKSVKGNNS